MPSAIVENGLFWSTRVNTWFYRIKVDGKVYTGDTGTANKPLALRRRDEIRQRIRERKAGFSSAEAPTVQQLVTAFLKERKGELDPKTLGIIELRYRLHWQSIALMPANQVHNGVVAELRRIYLEGKDDTKFNRTNGGANKIVASLSQVFGWAIETNRLDEMPFRLKKLKVEKRTAGVVWPEHIRDWVRASRACHNVHARLAMLGAMTQGFRESEALGMDWKYFDWAGRRYRVPANLAKDGESRAIPFHPIFERVMRFCWLRAGKPKAGLVLPAKDGEPHREGYLRKPVDTTARRMGIANMYPHRLRATFATGVWESGATLAQIMAWLGHEDPETSMLYIVQREQKGEAVQERFAQTAGWRTRKSAP
ncbi:MAG TPA: site-specific integrase, partial [Holophagaceae bacterium]|nr:site-specific integrase [Holophagaceae bacterium]